MDEWTDSYKELEANVSVLLDELDRENIERFAVQQKNLVLQNAAEILENTVGQLSKENSKLVKKNEKLEKEQSLFDKSLFDCSICYEKSVENRMIFVPCGHTACKKCSEEWKEKTCHMCRARIEKKVKIIL